MGPAVPDGRHARAIPTATRRSSRSGGEIWLFWPTILDHRWEGALLKYQAAGPVEPPQPDPLDAVGRDPRHPGQRRLRGRHRQGGRGPHRGGEVEVSRGARRPSRLARETSSTSGSAGCRASTRSPCPPIPSEAPGPVDPAALLRHVLGVDHGDQRRSGEDLDDEPPHDRLRQHPAQPGAEERRDARGLTCGTTGRTTGSA